MLYLRKKVKINVAPKENQATFAPGAFWIRRWLHLSSGVAFPCTRCVCVWVIRFTVYFSFTNLPVFVCSGSLSCDTMPHPFCSQQFVHSDFQHSPRNAGHFSFFPLGLTQGFLLRATHQVVPRHLLYRGRTHWGSGLHCNTYLPPFHLFTFLLPCICTHARIVFLNMGTRLCCFSVLLRTGLASSTPGSLISHDGTDKPVLST